MKRTLAVLDTVELLAPLSKGRLTSMAECVVVAPSSALLSFASLRFVAVLLSGCVAVLRYAVCVLLLSLSPPTHALSVCCWRLLCLIVAYNPLR